ncbi:MAG: hypothetical protein SO135_00065 [Sphaerochaetaceae bacterium]|jgi:hypothetical protein|nr:hypothetical protein [Sphaerochaetaceae bacterium]NLY07937.1 hypothetical protein [Spirochaetales bacterium]
MGRIKTALEIALEKMEEIHIDEEKIQNENMKSDARSIAGTYLENDRMQEDELEKRLSKYSGASLNLVTNTINSIIIQNLVMPSGIEYKTRNNRVAELFKIINDGNTKATELVNQIMGLEDQYWEAMSGLLDKLKDQYKDALAQSDVPPEQNKDFLNMYQANVKQMNKQFGSVLEKAKSQLKTMLGME